LCYNYAQGHHFNNPDNRQATDSLTHLRIKTGILPALLCILAMLPGCSSHSAADGTAHDSKRIVDLVINENSTALVLTITLPIRPAILKDPAAS